jgi:glutamine amidotransferase
MCEIYGFSGNRKKELNNDLREFYSHADEHPNGWGLALFGEHKIEMSKEACRADNSTLLGEKLNIPIIAKNALAHIRLATIGNVEQDNCHPFTASDNSGRTWTLIHNGTVFESDKLNKYIFLQKGETDSERILLYIIDRINEAIEQLRRFPSAEERFDILDEIVRGSSPKNKLNLLIYDGETLYVHTNFRNSLYYRRGESGVTFSTRPLSEEAWKNVPFTTLLGYKNGTRVYTGTNHNNEYFFDPSTYNPLYMAYSGL